MMKTEEVKTNGMHNESDAESDSSGEELPIWVRGEQRWVSGVISQTTCQDIINVLLKDEEARGKCVHQPDHYHITERWRGVEQPLDPQATILDIWNAWGTAQPEVKIALRRIKERRKHCKSDSSTRSDRSAYKTVHPRRFNALQNEKQPSNTEQLIKLVLAQGEVIRRQLRKLRHSEHQIGYLEEKAHKARERKHGSNYLLETYLKGLSEAVDPNLEENRTSDSGVVTEGDSENNKPSSSSVENDRFSASSEEIQKNDENEQYEPSEISLKEQSDLYDMISHINKKLLKQEECLVRLHANIKKYDKENIDVNKALTAVRTEMTKSSCEMQHNEVVLEETMEQISSRRTYLDVLHRDLVHEEQEYEMLQTLLYSTTQKFHTKQAMYDSTHYNTKDVLDTLV